MGFGSRIPWRGALLALGFLGAGCGDDAPRGPLRLAAAASLSEALPPLLARWQAAGGAAVEVAFASSGELAAQVRHGAAFDLVILAAQAPAQRLADDGLLRGETLRPLLRNELVLAVAPSSAPAVEAQLAEVLHPLAGQRVAIGGDGVPAGDYARLWMAAQRVSASSVDLVELAHVRAVLAAVESGTCTAGFVYASDAAGRLRVRARAAEAEIGPVLYASAVTASCTAPQQAASLLSFLADQGADWERAGFQPGIVGELPAQRQPAWRGESALALAARTLAIGLLAVLVELPLALLLGRWLARGSFPGKTLIQSILVLPMFLPPVAVGLALLLLLAPRGPLAGAGGLLLYREGAAVLAAAVISFPILLRHVEHALAAVPVRLLQVSATLGAGAWKTFLRVELPLARRGLAAGLLLAFARGVGEYGATSVVAGVIPGRTETLATGIYRRLSSGDDGGAVLLAAVSVAIGLLAVLASEALLRGERPR